VVGLLAGALALTACAGPQTPTPPAAQGPHAVVVPRQAERILDQVDAALARATGRRDAAALAPRVVGPAHEQLTADIAVQRALKRPGTAAAPVTSSRLLLPRAGSWPRWFVAAGTSPAEPTPVVRLLWSRSARAPYGLWGELALLPGASLPEVGQQSGAEVLSPDAGSGLVMSPRAVLQRYATVLTGTATAQVRKQFAPDDFQSQLADRLVADRKSLGTKSVADVTTEQRQTRHGIHALRTSDGGALVFGALEQVYLVKVRPGKGSVLVRDRELAALFGNGRITRELRRTSSEVLAFHVPPAGSSRPVQLVAAGKADVRAAGA
jgi:hypothetical protein